MSDYLEKLPLSVQQHMNRVQTLANQAASGQYVAPSEMQNALNTLAQSSAEHAFMLMAAAMGKSTLSMVESTYDIETDQVVKKCLGVTYHTETHTKTYQTMRRRDIKLY